MNAPTDTLHKDWQIEAERLQLFVAQVTDYAIYTLSPEGNITSWNAGAQRFKGYLPEEIIGRHFSVFYSDEDRADGLPAQALKTAITAGKFENEGWRVRKDGSHFWASVVIDPIRDATGELAGFTKITRDITELRSAAAALHSSEEQFRLLVEGVTDYAIYMLTPDGNIANWNTGARRIKGYEQEEVIGTHFSRFYTEEDRADNLPQRALAVATREGRYESEGWRLRKDGTRFWAHVIIDPIKDFRGELIGFAKITRDVTERRDAEQALQATREALFQTQKLEALGKLTGGVAHDFNNLLSVIVNGLSILRMIIHEDQALKVIDSMERATTRGTSLTHQLLAFARQQPLQPEEHDANRVIRSFEAVLRRANRGSVNFNLVLGASLPKILIDAPQFEAGLLNLLVNARDATPDGGSISLHTSIADLAANEINKLPPGRYVKVAVIDTGEGINPEIMTRIIEPFYTTKPIGQGTGLGLSQVYGFIQNAGGDMKIESEIGRGTTISLYFPALTNEPDAVDPDGDPERVLIVDDQADVLDVAAELFRNLGYEVLAANNGEDALKILKDAPNIHLLFTDVVMPEMSGIELARAARALIPDIQIILASGYAEPVLQASSVAFDEFAFISKPYRVSEIIKKLRRLT